MTELALEQVIVEKHGARLLDDVSLRLGAGAMTCLLGPNGAGKSTLLKTALGLETPTAGSVTLDGEGLATLPPPDRARRVAYLPQDRPLAWPLLVRDVVALGRFAFGSRLGKLKTADAHAVSRAMESCAVLPFANRRADTLSGGERARVHLARALAAETPILLADEPVQGLDPKYQFQVMDVLRRAVDAGTGVLCVLHDIDLAARYADRIVLLQDGRIIGDGGPDDVLDAARLESLYGVTANVDGRRIRLDGLV